MSKQILDSLPELIAAGILPEETAGNIIAFYSRKGEQQSQRQSIAFALLGSILVGLGIILIVAHNWDNLARPVKVFFSFLPLVAGQAVCAYVLFKQAGNRSWQEGSAAFLFFAVGASIALISQVYNIPGNLQNFLFTWLLLCFPLVYIMPSSLVSLLYIAGLTVYGVNEGYDNHAAHSFHYSWMFLLILPHYFSLLHKTPESNFTLFHNWFIPLSLTISLGSVAGEPGVYLFPAYMNMFAAFYLLSRTRAFQSERLRKNSYLIIGTLGTIIILLITSFDSFWQDSVRHRRPGMPEIVAIIITFSAAGYLLYRHIRYENRTSGNVLSFVFIAFLIVFMVGISAPMLATVFINILVLAVAIFTMQRGLLLSHLGILNFGLLITTVLAACRFFDTNISFVLRGLMFLAVGAGFFIANTMLLKKRRQHA